MRVNPPFDLIPVVFFDLPIPFPLQHHPKEALSGLEV
jgi:hypothetical protein